MAAVAGVIFSDMVPRIQHCTRFSVYKLTRRCTLLACHQAVVVNVSDLLHPSEPSECVVLHRLKHSGRAAPLCCKGTAFTMLASLWLCLADPTLCHALLVDRNKHVFLASRLALV